MVTCDLCWEGRHTRCGGRNDCLCGVCSGKDRPKHHVRQEQQAAGKPKLAVPNPFTGARLHQTAPLTRPFTNGDLVAAREVLQNLPTLFEQERFRRNISFEAVGAETGLSEQSLRRMVQGKLTQGMTARSLVVLLAWLETSGGVTPQEQWQARTEPSRVVAGDF